MSLPLSQPQSRVDAAARLPSLLRSSPIAIVIAIVVANAIQFADPDLWGHVAFGRAVLNSWRLPLADPYSYSAPNHLWLNHEWLTEVLMALCYNGLGVVGLKLFKLACAAITIIFLAIAESKTGAPQVVQLATLLWVAAAIGPQVQFRPQLFTFAMLSAMLALLARHNYRGRAPLWLAIPIVALWSNLHGGFIIGLAVLGTYTVAIGLRSLRAGSGWKETSRFAMLTVGATVATLATPYGIGTWRAVAHALQNPVTRHVVTDWRPLAAILVGQWHLYRPGLLIYLPALALPAMLAVSLARRPRWDDLPLLLIAALMTVAAIVSARNLALAVIASSVPLAYHTGLFFAARATTPDKEPAARAVRLNPLFIGLAGIALIAFTGELSGNLRSPPRATPVGAVAFMKKHHLSGNILCDFGWGEYLIWHMAPESKVFIDGRYDTVYPDRVIHDYLDFYFAHPRAANVLYDYPHGYVLIPPISAAFRFMEGRSDWKLIYRDPGAALFVRSGSEAAKSPMTKVVTGTTPDRFP